MFGSVGPTELILILCILIIIAPAILFLLTLQKALSRCSPENRTMPPGWVWMMLIPLFNVFWQFILVSHIARSLAREFQGRNIPAGPYPGRNVGMAWCVLNVSSGSLLAVMSAFGYVLGLGALICWISYWVKISGYSARLAASDAGGRVPTPANPAD